jgi:hypothetical protein
VPGLIKTSPSNRHYVAALRSYLSEAGLGAAIMVRDANSDNGDDLYAKTLEDEFESQMGEILKNQTQQYTGKSSTATNTPPSLFDNVRANICSAAAGERNLAVLYAGREIDLGDFIDVLQSQPCRDDRPLTILTAGVELGKVLRGKDLRAAKLTVLNAAPVDPEGWSKGSLDRPKYFEKFRKAFVDGEHFAADHRADGGAIMMHDAVMAAARAIRLAAAEGSASAVTANAVRGQLLNINTGYPVLGASGTLQFSKQPSGNGTGIPKDKPIPVLRYPTPNSTVPSQQVGQLCYVADTPSNVHCGAATPP